MTWQEDQLPDWAKKERAEAAAEIERLREENRKLREMLLDELAKPESPNEQKAESPVTVDGRYYPSPRDDFSPENDPFSDVN